MTSKMSLRSEGRSASASSVESDFATDFRRFLMDEENAGLLRNVIIGPLMQEIQRLTEVIEQKDETITSLQHTVDELTFKVDDLEQYTRRNSVRISGIPEAKNESCETEMLKLANDVLQLDPPLEPRDIDRTHRVGRQPEDPSKPRAIILKLATYRQRRRIMDARNKLKDHTPKIYINEDLTRLRTNLCFHARRAKANGHIKDVKTFDGRVVITPLSGPAATVRSLVELEAQYQG